MCISRIGYSAHARATLQQIVVSAATAAAGSAGGILELDHLARARPQEASSSCFVWLCGPAREKKRER
jgi:hypothetical protein